MEIFNGSFPQLLPVALKAFFKRRLGQIFGLLLLGAGIAVGVCVATYNPLDPSWNLASNIPVRNYLSSPGAIVADALIQTFGGASFFYIIALMIWGVQRLFGHFPPWMLGRMIGLSGAVLLIAQQLACFTSQNLGKISWFFPCGAGGAMGDILLYYSQRFLGESFLWVCASALIFIPLSVMLFLTGLGLPVNQLGRGLKMAGLTMAKIPANLYRFTKSARLHPPCEEEFSPVLRNGEPEPQGKTIALPIFGTEGERSFLHANPQDRTDYNPASGFSTDSPVISDSFQEFDDTYPEKSDSPDPFMHSKINTALKKSSTDLHLSPDPANRLDEYSLPSFDLLDTSRHKIIRTIDPHLLETAASQLKVVLEEYGVKGEIVTVRPGPVVTMYEFKPAAGIKTARVIGLADDIARSMSALSTRIAIIPGRNVIGIELPNATRETVYLRELLQSESYDKTSSALPLILGKDIGGHPVITDLTRMPHLLVAGTTGSGKSVAINTMILSLLFRLPPDHCKFIMIDPKMLELSVYDGIPHLLSPVVTDPKKAVVALKWAVREMESRYRAMSKLGVRNIEGYNSRIMEARQTGEMLVRRVQTGFDPDSGKPIFENQSLDLERLPFIVVVVDEMADLMLVAGKEIEGAVQRLAQMARAAGIHLIMATQRPSVDVITGTIKANFPTRISFQVTSRIDSRTILGDQGAEQLLGQGDMLYMVGGGRVMRVHGPFVRDDEVERIVAFLKMQAEPSYIEGLTTDEDEPLSIENNEDDEKDSLYSQAVDLVLREGKASTSFIQRHLKIGYNKAASIIESMEKKGVVSQANHVGKREVLH